MPAPVPHRSQRSAARPARTAPRGSGEWRSRLEGREHVSEQLAQLAVRPDVVLLPRRRMPHGRGSIDLLAVGPGGVTVVNALLLSGRLTIVPARPGAPARLLVGGHDHTSVVTEVEGAVNLVRRALSAGGRPAPPVHGALCVPGDWELAPFATCELRDVTIDGPGTVALIAGRDGSLPAAAVARTAERLQRAFPSAGPRRYAA